jgi:pimeloyl-ACP methyl ester carboxylesterase
MPSSSPLVSRRRALAIGLGGSAVVIGGGIAGVRLFHHRDTGGVLRGASLASLQGYCFAGPTELPARGPLYTGQFYSSARRRSVHYTLAYPPGFRAGNVLPLCVYLHPLGGDYESTYGGFPLDIALALGLDGGHLRPMAMICADGGDGYWHPQAGDDPMSMVVDELVPMCRRIGLGLAPRSVVVTGISMGGYGALLYAERYPDTFAACAAISPSIWPSYAAAARAHPPAFASSSQFDEYNVVASAALLEGRPVRVASGLADPFHNGVVAFAKASPSGVRVDFLPGGQGGTFAHDQAFPSLEFLTAHLPPSSTAAERGPVCAAKVLEEDKTASSP